MTLSSPNVIGRGHGSETILSIKRSSKRSSVSNRNSRIMPIQLACKRIRLTPGSRGVEPYANLTGIDEFHVQKPHDPRFLVQTARPVKGKIHDRIESGCPHQGSRHTHPGPCQRMIHRSSQRVSRNPWLDRRARSKINNPAKFLRIPIHQYVTNPEISMYEDGLQRQAI